MEQAILTTVLLLAVYQDSVRNKIPNHLCAAGMLSGILYFVCFQGMKVCVEHCIWAAGWMLVFFVLWRFKIFGGGDVKLIVTSGLLLGENSIPFLMCGGICMGIHAFGLMIFRKNYIRRMTIFVNYVLACIEQRKWIPYPFDRNKEYADGGIRLSYGLAAGHFVAMLMGLYQ